MGVRGLTTYIANNHKKYLKRHQLHSCYVIIDGNSLACQLFTRFASRAHCAFGGDYDRYAQYLREFFNLLAKCDVKAIVIFDGGYERRKVNTVISRMSERIAAMKYVKPCSQDSAIIFPLFLRVVFKQLLKEMNIPFVQCDFEADQEIAALAYKYNCPVLSYDSDFYIFDVNYIPIPLIEFEAAPLNFDIGQNSQKYCINCKIYKIDFFLKSFGGLDKTMLPLLASLLGNDYVKIKAFRKFYSQFNLSKGNGNPLQKKIARVIEWLRNETFESAIERILGRIKVIKHKSITRNITHVVNAYTNLNVTIESYLPPEFTNGLVEKPIDIKKRDCSMLDAAKSSNNGEDMDIEMKEIESEETEGSDCSLSEDENELDAFDEMANKEVLKNSDEMDVEMLDQLKNIKKTVSKVTAKLPEWLLDYSRRGHIEPCITDILTLGTYFALPQIEDSFSKTSHFTSLSLIKIICKLLLDNLLQEISLWTKNENSRVQRFLVNFLETQKITDLELVPTLSIDQKKSLFFQCLNIPAEFCIDSFPDEWKLYVCAIIFWIKNTSQPMVAECHLISLCMSMVALSVIDTKVGFFRKKIQFLKRYGKLKKRIIKRIEFGFSDSDIVDNEYDCEVNLNKETPSSNDGEISNEPPSSIKQLISSVSTEDCIAVYEEFYSFHQLDENLKINKSLFSMQDIHVFAQFQSSLYHIVLLNSLLAFPLQEPKISSLYSGTFVYNLCIALKTFESTTEKYLESLLKYSPKIMSLIITMCSEIAKVAPVVVQKQAVKKNRRRKRRRTAKSIQEDKADVGDKSIESKDAEDSSFFDENNAFSLLSV